MRLKGKVAIITGGAHGMGAEEARLFAREGAKVVIADIREEDSRKVEAEIAEAGGEAMVVMLDVSQEDQWERAVAEVVAQFGKLDILVNNAGIGGSGETDFRSTESWDRLMDINAKGVFLGMKHAIPKMEKAGGGSIINISSIYGVVANDPTLYLGTDMKQPATYSFVKAGMINFTRYLANYYGKQGIRANCISPGGYFDNQPEAFVDEYTRRVPVGRMLDNEDIKGAVVYLASDASEYVNGHNLLVDGGWTTV